MYLVFKLLILVKGPPQGVLETPDEKHNDAANYRYYAEVDQLRIYFTLQLI